ncbi:MAG: phasin family protein [Pseudoxanthomonas sp.]|nr:phasin family protein [Pseudoxanthomonas sp.]
MNATATLPIALYKANVALQVRIGELVQAGSRHWFDFGQRLLNDGLVENQAELQQILRAQDWQKLAALPADTFWRQVQQRFGDQQAAAQIAVATQSAFARDLQDALVSWQHEMIEAMDEAGLGQAIPAFETDWTALFGGQPPVLKTTARRRPASDAAPERAKPRSAPAKKTTTTTRRTAAKKTAGKAAKKAPR